MSKISFWSLAAHTQGKVPQWQRQGDPDLVDTYIVSVAVSIDYLIYFKIQRFKFLRMSSISICVKWSGKEYEVSELATSDTVEILKVKTT